MNIVQLHERVRFWTDLVQSTRFESSDLDNACNAAMNDIVDQKYYSTRKLTQGDSFQRTQKIRNELQTLVKDLDTDTPGAVLQNYTGYSIIPASSYPDDYKYLLCIAIYDGTTPYNCWPITYDRVNAFTTNPFRRPRLIPFPKAYYNEGQEGIRILHAISSPSKAIFYYLAQAVQWQYGIEYTSTTGLTVGQVIICVSDSALYNDIQMLRGDEAVIQAPNVLHNGTVVANHVDSDLNFNLHEMVARQAAVNLMISIENYEKVKTLTALFT